MEPVRLVLLLLAGPREGENDFLEFPSIDDAVAYGRELYGERRFQLEGIEDARGRSLVSYDDLNERCIRNPVATYFVEADTGASMVDFGIYPGDTLVVDRSIDARHGDVVMALWDGGYMVKQLRIHGRRVELHSGNPDNPPIVVPPETELLIWGVVTWSFRKQFRRG